jgi:hypothetical protein
MIAVLSAEQARQIDNSLVPVTVILPSQKSSGTVDFSQHFPSSTSSSSIIEEEVSPQLEPSRGHNRTQRAKPKQLSFHVFPL